MPDDKPYTVEQSGTMQIVRTVPAWMWRCNTCGWVGLGLPGHGAATDEAEAHITKEHPND